MREEAATAEVVRAKAVRAQAEMKATAVGGGEASGGSPTAWRTPPAPPKRISPLGLPPSHFAEALLPPRMPGEEPEFGRDCSLSNITAQLRCSWVGSSGAECSRESVGEQVSGESRHAGIGE